MRNSKTQNLFNTSSINNKSKSPKRKILVDKDEILKEFLYYKLNNNATNKKSITSDKNIERSMSSKLKEKKTKGSASNLIPIRTVKANKDKDEDQKSRRTLNASQTDINRTKVNSTQNIQSSIKQYINYYILETTIKTDLKSVEGNPSDSGSNFNDTLKQSKAAKWNPRKIKSKYNQNKKLDIYGIKINYMILDLYKACCSGANKNSTLSLKNKVNRTNESENYTTMKFTIEKESVESNSGTGPVSAGARSVGIISGGTGTAHKNHEGDEHQKKIQENYDKCKITI
jgi:hypothetical protein